MVKTIELTGHFADEGYFFYIDVIDSEDFAMLVRGEYPYGSFKLVPPPDEDLSVDAMKWHEAILAAQDKAMYANVYLLRLQIMSRRSGHPPRTAPGPAIVGRVPVKTP